MFGSPILFVSGGFIPASCMLGRAGKTRWLARIFFGLLGSRSARKGRLIVCGGHITRKGAKISLVLSFPLLSEPFQPSRPRPMKGKVFARTMAHRCGKENCGGALAVELGDWKLDAGMGKKEEVKICF